MGEGLGEQLAWSRPRWQGDKSTAVPMLSNAHQQRGCPCLGSPWLCRSHGPGKPARCVWRTHPEEVLTPHKGSPLQETLRHTLESRF